MMNQAARKRKKWLTFTSGQTIATPSRIGKMVPKSPTAPAISSSVNRMPRSSIPVLSAIGTLFLCLLSFLGVVEGYSPEINVFRLIFQQISPVNLLKLLMVRM